MQPIKNISIPQACHQSWREMAPANSGRHCQQCSKIVTDFTSMSNNEIITYLAGSSDICGRFEPRQLDSINQQLYTAPASRKLKGWAMAIGLLGSITFFKANAQAVIPAV